MTELYNGPDAQNIELLDGDVKNRFSPSIYITADVLATDSWQPLVDATQSDYRERGLVVGRHLKRGHLIRSKIFEGSCEEKDENTHETLPAAFHIPMFPFGVIKGLSMRVREDVVIHTHPIPPELNHLRTTPISDQDIRCFAGAKYSALVMLDKGGAHLLTKTASSLSESRRLHTSNIVDTAVREVVEESGGSMDVMTKIAHTLSPYGYGYYYTPDLSQRGDTVKFRNLRVAHHHA